MFFQTLIDFLSNLDFSAISGFIENVLALLEGI